MPKKVLIVDDELSILIPLQFLMEKCGYTVMMAQSGKEAIEMVETDRPDLILLDIMLPDLDGYEVYQMLRDNPEWDRIKIVFLTARSREEDITRGLALGADGYISKPYSNADLVDKVARLLD